LRANHFCGNFFSFDDALAVRERKEKGEKLTKKETHLKG
jgi:hypothetical protein